MSEDRFTYTELVGYYTDKMMEGIRKGTSMRSLVADIVNTAAHWGAENVREYEKANPTKTRHDWRPISSAPKDGTVIIVTETPNGEHYNVVPAAWMAYGAKGLDNEGEGRWWGMDVARWAGEEGPLYVRFKPLAITPICWKPMPDAEPESKLRRRMSAIR